MSHTSAIHLPPGKHLQELQHTKKCNLTAPEDERQETLRNLLVTHHGAAAPLREPHLVLHDHMPHILCSGFDLGQDSALLNETYERTMKTLVKIDHTFARGEKIEGGRLREYMGKREFTVAFVDFFDEEFRKENGKWKEVVARYLYEGDRPLMNGLIGGLGHPIIHLAYAYDFECKEIASEGLSLLLTDYSDFHHLMEETRPATPKYTTSSLAEVVEHVYHDSRFDNLTQHPGIVEIGKVMEAQGSAVVEHWNAWTPTDQLQQLEHICDLGTLLGLTTFDHEMEFDFFLLHTMTVAHGIRSMWLHIPENKRADMLREYGLLVISVYVCQQRPLIRPERITDVDLDGRDWEWVRRAAREHPAKFDVHFYKAVRAPEEFERTWGEKDGFYLKAAVRFLDDFRGWTGFGEGIPGFDEKQEGWSARREYRI